MKSKVGYHYTSYANWLGIEDEGLKPYPLPNLKHQEIKEVVEGVWLWKSKLQGSSHTGTVLYQASKKAVTKVVLLEVRYDPEDLVKIDGRSLSLTHEGYLENWSYHNNEASVIVSKSIPLEDIRLIRVYDIVELLK